MTTKTLTAVVKREGEVNKELRAKAIIRGVFVVDDVVDLAHASGDEEREHERRDVPAASPKEDVDGVEAAEDSKAVSNGVDDDGLAGRRELEEHHEQEQEMDQRPDPKGVCRGSHIGLLWTGQWVSLGRWQTHISTHIGRTVCVLGPRHRVDIGTEGDNEDEDVEELRKSVNIAVTVRGFTLMWIPSKKAMLVMTCGLIGREENVGEQKRTPATRAVCLTSVARDEVVGGPK